MGGVGGYRPKPRGSRHWPASIGAAVFLSGRHSGVQIWDAVTSGRRITADHGGSRRITADHGGSQRATAARRAPGRGDGRRVLAGGGRRGAGLRRRAGRWRCVASGASLGGTGPGSRSRRGRRPPAPAAPPAAPAPSAAGLDRGAGLVHHRFCACPASSRRWHCWRGGAGGWIAAAPCALLGDRGPWAEDREKGWLLRNRAGDR